MKEKEKLIYLLNILSEAYSYMGDLVDALKKEDETVAYVKNKIEIAEMQNKFDHGEGRTNAFAAKKGG